MPELYVLAFDLKAIFKLFPKMDKETERRLEEYETYMSENMESNRKRLFCY